MRLISTRRRALVGTRSNPLSLLTLEDRIAPSTAPTQWSVRGAGGGGSLYSPAINPANPSEYYISSDMGELFHSTTAGASWQMVPFGQLQGGPQTFVQYTNNPNILYALDYLEVDGSNTNIPAESTNGGQTWQPLANDPTGGGAFYFLADPANPNLLAITDYTNLYFSSNAGQTWSVKYTAADSGAGLVLGGAFWNGSSIYFGTNDGIVASTNGGQSFALMSLGGIPFGQSIVSFAGAGSGSTVRFLAVTDDSGNVYGGVEGYDNDGETSVYTLTLGATSWTADTIPSTVWPYYAGMSLTDVNTMYVAGSNSAGTPTVYKSTNSGSNWQSVFLTTGNANIETGWSGSSGDRGWGYGQVALGFDVDPANSSTLIISDEGFAHASTNGGTSWQALSVIPADLNPAGANTPKGLSYQDSGLDNTSSWQVAFSGTNNVIIADTDVQGELSTNGGQTFGFGYSAPSYNTIYHIATASSGTLYAAAGSRHDLYESTTLTDAAIDSATGAVLFSTNNGVTWLTLHNFGHEVDWVATDPTDSNRLYASVVNSTYGGIYVTNDLSDGANSVWTELTAPPRTQGHPLDIDVLNNGTLVVSFSARRTTNFTNSSGVFVSTNGGTTWVDRSAAGMDYWTLDVVIDPNDPTQNTWLAGVWSGWGGVANNLGGLYLTTNAGVSWTRILDIDGVTSATFNLTDPNGVYVTTEDDGLLYSDNFTSKSPTFPQVMSYPFDQPERVFFNPANPNQVWVTSFGGGVMVGTTPSSTNISVGVPTAPVYGQLVTLSATISAVAPATGTPTGSVTFYDNGTALAGGLSVALVNGITTYTTTSLAVGNHSITVSYSGDDNFLAGSTTSGSAFTVGKDNVALTASSSANPANFGAAVTFSATITAASPGSGTPTGTATFYDGGAPLSTVSLTNAKATYSTSSLAVGSHQISVMYNGDGNFTSGTSSAIAQGVYAAPMVSSVVVNGSQKQQSMVTSIQVTFSTAVNIAALQNAFAFTRMKLPNGAPGDKATIGTITVSPSTGTTTTSAVLTFSGTNSEGGSLADGNWTLTINQADVVNNGITMAANYTQAGIKRLFGDYNGTGIVDSSDLGVLGTTFGLSSNEAGYIGAFDSDGNGEIDSTDLSAFGARFGLSIS